MDMAPSDPLGTMDARLLGQTLGESYRVLRRIGAGGMGQVYEAEHTLLGRHFALKVLDTEQLTRRDAVQRFFAEARAASQIEHPHIVDVVHFVTDGPFMVLVMELLRGESLAERLTRGPMPLAEAATVLSQVCDAVAATHAAGILHRDLKPANVFLCEHSAGPHAKVLDFGISKLKPGAATHAEGEPAVGVTTTGQLLGTPRYLSPEQARGSLDLDERSDVYAAGVMLFEMIAGAPPFDGHNAFQLIWKHGNETAPRLSERAEGISPALDEVLVRALAKDPEERFPSMLALRDAVRSAVSESAQPTGAASGGGVPPATTEEVGGEAGQPGRAGLASTSRLRWALALGALGAVTVGLVVYGAGHAAPDDGSQDLALQDRASAAQPDGLERALPASLTAERGGSTAEGDAAHDAPSAPAPTSTAPQPPASPPASVHVPLRVQPSHAQVSVDDGPPQPAGDGLELPVGRERTLTFTAPGYATEVRTIVPSTDSTLSVTLTRRRGRAPQGNPSSPIKQHF